MIMRNYFIPSLSTLSFIMLAGAFASQTSCATYKEELPCPDIILMKDTSAVTIFTDGKTKTNDNKQGIIKLVGYGGTCSLNKDETSMNVELTARFEARPEDNSISHTLNAQYFVAIPAYYPSKDAKHIYDMSIELPVGTNLIVYTAEPVSFSVPLSVSMGIEDGSEGTKDVPPVYLGLQMDKASLAHNRKTAANNKQTLLKDKNIK